MRHLAAIVAAVMSVTTGGPLRCPCQVTAFVRSSACESASGQTKPAADQPQKCGCKAHAAAEAPPPAEETPPTPEPCKHGRGIDLVAPAAGSDRQAGASEHAGVSLVVSTETLGSLAVRRGSSLPHGTHGTHTTLLSRLRYSHSFRS